MGRLAGLGWKKPQLKNDIATVDVTAHGSGATDLLCVEISERRQHQNLGANGRARHFLGGQDPQTVISFDHFV